MIVAESSITRNVEGGMKRVYQLLVKIPSALGALSAGYFGKGKKGFDRFYLAVSACPDQGTEIWIYVVQD